MGVTVRRSPINGSGVFADRPFAPEELVLRIDDSHAVDVEHPVPAEQDPRHCDYLEGGRVVLMQSPERHINHSCDPNVYVQTVKGVRSVVALRAIANGEEIAYDYCINGYGDTLWTCNCGAARCRKDIHSDFFHPPRELQKEYLPLLDSWFRSERTDEVEALETAVRCRNADAPARE